MEGLDEQLSATRRSAAELFAAQMQAHARPAEALQTAQEAAGRANSGGSLSSWLSSAAGALLGRAAGSSRSESERPSAAFSPPHTPAPAATQRSSARPECPYGVGDAVLYRGARGSEEARVTAVDWLDDATPSLTLRCAADGRQVETVLSRLQPLRETASQRAAQEAADAELARALQAEEDATEAQAAQAPVSMQQMLLQMLNAAAQGAHNPQNPAATHRFEIPGVPGASVTFSTSAAPMPAAGVGMFPFGALFGGAGLAPLFGGLGGGEMSYEELLALQERMGGAQAAGASAQQISALPTRHYAARDGGEDTCSICLSTFEEGEELRVLPCAHGFHRGCVDRWLGTRKQCPCCRAEL